jgi:thiol-disulfide isomerase/thioredoxin
MGIVKVHLTNQMNNERKSKSESGIDIVQFNKDFESADKKFVVYMTPGCIHCINLYKTFYSLAKSLNGKIVKDDEHVVIAALYVDGNNVNNNDVLGITPLAGNLSNITRNMYPTLFLYDNHAIDERYEGDRSPGVLKQWLIKKLGIIVDKNVGKINEGSKRKTRRKWKIRGKKKVKKKKKKPSRWNKIRKYTRKLSIMKRLKRRKKKRGRKSKKSKTKLKSKARKIMKAFTRKLLNL